MSEVNRDPMRGEQDSIRQVLSLPAPGATSEPSGGAASLDLPDRQFSALAPEDLYTLEQSYEGIHANATKDELFQALGETYGSLPEELLRKVHTARLDAGEYEIIDTKPRYLDGGRKISHSIPAEVSNQGVPGLHMIHGLPGEEMRQTSINPEDIPSLESELIYLRWLCRKLRQ